MQDRRTHSYWDSIATGFLIGVFFCFLLVAGMHVVVRDSLTEITEIQVVGSRGVSADDIEQSVTGYLHHNCFIHVSCSYGLWYQVANVGHRLLRQYPRLDTVSVSVDDHVMRIDVTERTAVFRWCPTGVPDNCYYVDAEGIVYEKAPNMPGYGALPLVIPDTQKIRISDIVGRAMPFRLWDQDTMTSVMHMIDIVRQHGSVVRIVYTERDMLLYMDSLYTYYTDTHPYIKINREDLGNPEYMQSLSLSLFRFETFEPFFGRFKIYPDSLDYLDLRFTGRAYMRFKTSEPESVDMSSDPVAVQ